MKNGLMAFLATMCILLTSAIVASVESRTVRASEVERILSNSISTTLEVLKEEQSEYFLGTPKIYSEAWTESNMTDKMIDYFEEEFKGQVASDSDMKVSILTADPINGILDVNVDYSYTYINGKNTTKSVRKTGILEDYAVDIKNRAPVLLGLTVNVDYQNRNAAGQVWVDISARTYDSDGDAVTVEWQDEVKSGYYSLGEYTAIARAVDSKGKASKWKEVSFTIENPPPSAPSLSIEYENGGKIDSTHTVEIVYVTMQATDPENDPLRYSLVCNGATSVEKVADNKYKLTFSKPVTNLEIKGCAYDDKGLRSEYTTDTISVTKVFSLTDGSVLRYDDDGGDGLNSKFTYTVEAGKTYAYCVGAFSTGSLNKTYGWSISYNGSVIHSGSFTVREGTWATKTYDPNCVFFFEPTVTGTYTFESYGSGDPCGYLVFISD